MRLEINKHKKPIFRQSKPLLIPVSIFQTGDIVILPKAPVERLIRSSGAERVSDGAARQLAEVLEKIGYTISEQAKKYAMHAGRKTVVGQDIKLASEDWMRDV